MFKQWMVPVIGAIAAAGTVAPPPSLAVDIDDVHPDFFAAHYSTEDGLPVNVIASVRQGPDGYLWLATFDGLARFDGHRFVTFRRAGYPELPSNRLSNQLFDGDGVLWLFTDNERVVRFDGRRFERVERDADGGRLGRIQVPVLDKERRLWLATSTGVFRFGAGAFRRVCPPVGEIEIRSMAPGAGDVVYLGTTEHGVLGCDTDGSFTPEGLAVLRSPVAGMTWWKGALWFVDRRGLNRYDGNEVRLLSLDLEPVGLGGAIARIIGTPDHLWIVTERELYRTDGDSIETLARQGRSGARIRRFVAADGQGGHWFAYGRELYHDDVLIARLPGRISDLEIDIGGAVWVSTQARGLYRVQPRVGDVFADVPELAHANLYAVAASPSRTGRVWLGGLGTGLLALEGGAIERVMPAAPGAEESALMRNVLWTVLEDDRERVWLGGTWLCILSDTARCDTANVPEELARPSVTQEIRMLFEDRRGDIWIGAVTGLYRFRNEQFERIENAPDDVMRTGLHRRDGSIWFGSHGSGLWAWRNGALHPVTLERAHDGRLVRSLYEDDEGVLWVGTEDQGLIRLEVDDDLNVTDQRRFGPEDGLWDDVIHYIAEDDRGRLWMNSNRGIFWIERDALNAYRHGADLPLPVVGYTESNGLLNREGNGGVHSAGMMDRRGRLWFPGQSGVVRIDPATVHRDDRGSPVIIESAIMDGQRVGRPEHLTLPPEQRELSVRYTAPVFQHAERVRFRYRLVGHDDGWVDAGERREAFYTNLPSGEYRFEVMAADPYGRWSDGEAAIAVKVMPRYYERAWFIGLLVLAAALLVVLVFRHRVAHLRTRSARLEALVTERTRALRQEQAETEKALAKVARQAQKLKELDSAKSRFFTNLSHELRTPLTLIAGPAEQARAALDAGRPEQAAGQLGNIRDNAERLLELVNQILALSRLEAGYQQLNPATADLAAFCRQGLERFVPLARQQQVTLHGPGDGQRCVCPFDHDAVDKIIGNLVGNAIKHAPARTMVRLGLRRVTGGVVVSVGDEGPGIPPERLDKVFERFYTAAHEGAGAGIGLALARELAHLHGGDLNVESNPGEGSTFHLVLPLKISEWRQGAEDPVAVTGQAVAKRSRKGMESGDITTVLVVEDNPGVREFIVGCLESRYRVIGAGDGRAGLEAARRELPDVIVSDIMMPEVDGVEMVRALTVDPATTAIPVILLTARSSDIDELEGLQAGAVDYLTKPFAPEILIARVERMLAFARRLREQVRLEMAEEARVSDESEASTPVGKIETAIRRHLTDPTLDVERLAREAHVSRSQLKRVLDRAGLPPPSVLIRQHRLDEAARLLARGRGSVTEVAYATGFASLSHFARHFRARFGRNPSEYTDSLDKAEP